MSMGFGQQYLRLELATCNERVAHIEGLLVQAGILQDQGDMDALIERLRLWVSYRAFIAGSIGGRPEAQTRDHIQV